MVKSIEEKSQHKTNASVALHVLEIMHGFHISSEIGRHYMIKNTCNRPEAL